MLHLIINIIPSQGPVLHLIINIIPSQGPVSHLIINIIPSQGPVLHLIVSSDGPSHCPSPTGLLVLLEVPPPQVTSQADHPLQLPHSPVLKQASPENDQKVKL